MVVAKETVRYEKLLTIVNEKLQNEVKELRAEKEAIWARSEAVERSVDERIQELLASEATLWV